jgi:hypothetical protein
MPTPEQLASQGLRAHASTIAAGVVGVSTVALLAAGSLVPLIAGLASSTLTPSVIAGWLGGLGGNALASWLDEWGRSTTARALKQLSPDDPALVTALARDLQATIAVDPAIAGAVAGLLDRTDALSVSLAALEGQADAQGRLLQQLLADVRQASFRNEQLHNVTVRAIAEQGASLLAALAQSEHRVRTELTALLATIRAERAGDTNPRRVQTVVAPTGDAEPAGTSPVDSSWPLNVPDEPYYLLPGREQTVNALLEALQMPSGPSIVIVDGLGGLGKTALAAELVRRARVAGVAERVVGDSAKADVFAGGEIVHLQETRLDFDKLLDSIARQFDRWEVPTLRVEEKRVVVAQLLRQQRCLVLVDNLETAVGAHEIASQLQQLLGPSRAIITSRQHVPIDNARAVSLHGLDRQDALLFLRSDATQRGIEQIRAATDARLLDIVRVTGGAPLAMKLVVSQARHLDIDAVLHVLEHADQQLYFFVYRQSWQQLTLAAKKLLIYIGRTVVTTVGYDELARTDVARDGAELIAAIEQLVSYSLVEVAVVSGRPRYGLHQLTRNFVNSDLPRLWHTGGLSQ